VLAGDVRPLGNGYVLSARLVNASTGEVLWAGRQDVTDASGLSAAITQLSATLRERVGESLRSIRGGAPLDQVTTRSIEALRSYVEADRATNRGDESSAIALLQRAIAEDSSFAMAWRRLGVVVSNMGRDTSERNRAYRRAWELRDRLSARERFHTEATYAGWVKRDTAAAIAAYQAVLEKFPDDYAALNNLALWYNAQGRERDALAIWKRSVALGGAPSATYGNVIPLEYRLGDPDSARALLAQYGTAFPDHPQPRLLRASLLAAQEQFDSAEAILEAMREQYRGNPRYEAGTVNVLSSVYRARGRLKETARLADESVRLFLQRTPSFAPGIDRQLLQERLRLGNEAELTLTFAGDVDRARELAERGQQLLPLERFPVADRNWLNSADFYARLGMPQRARELITRWERDVSDSVRRDPPLARMRTDAAIAMAEGRHDDAIGLFHRLRQQQRNCPGCELYFLGEAFDRSNRPDSAIAYFESLLNIRILGPGVYWGPIMLRRLGQLYEARGNRDRALEYYGRFVDLWKDADPSLQPKVAETRRWIAQLAGEPR
jgi:tetratricopeptide (TPR) repeat protein